MKFTTPILVFFGVIFAQTLAAPSTETQADIVESLDDSNVSTDTTSALIEANEDIEDSPRAKKSSSPKTVCYEVRDQQGRNFMQCGQAADSESAGSYHLSSYSPAPPSYGSSSYGSSSYSAPSYKVS